MRLHIVFYSEHPVILPWNYQHLLHGFLYRVIAKSNPELGSFLHNQGFTVSFHSYKMLTFSRLYPSCARGLPEGLRCIPPIHWWVSSPISMTTEALAAGLLEERKAVLGSVCLEVEKVEVEPPPEFSGHVLCETLSPVVASTGIRRDEKLHKKFLSPDEPDFWRVVELNLRRKALAVGLPVGEGMKFESRGEWRSRLILVQGMQVKGYEGRFDLEGEEGLFRLAYEAGLGERNSQGFGMFRIARDNILKNRPPGL